MTGTGATLAPALKSGGAANNWLAGLGFGCAASRCRFASDGELAFLIGDRAGETLTGAMPGVARVVETAEVEDVEDVEDVEAGVALLSSAAVNGSTGSFASTAL